MTGYAEVARAATASVHIRIGAKVLEHFLPLFLINHEIDALAIMSTLGSALRFHEAGLEPLPVVAAAVLAQLLQRVLFDGTECFE